MATVTDSDRVDELFRALAEQLAEGGEPVELVVIGGAALIALGFVERATRDVDVVAVLVDGDLVRPDPLSAPLIRARDRVARDFALPADWLNTAPHSLLDFGLPVGLVERLERRRYGEFLTVYFAGRLDQIHFKLYALADQGPGKHASDLRALQPTTDELLQAARWTRTHDPSEGFRQELGNALAHLGGKMQISVFRERLGSVALDFAWSQWSQMGILAAAERRDVWAQDPEALIVFSLEVARDDPRLFDELLGWLVVNGDVVSRQRLANLCPAADPTRRLLDAALAWAGDNGSRLRSLTLAGDPGLSEPLFRSLPRVANPDQTFWSHGFSKPSADGRFRSGPPDRSQPVNLAFRLRDLLGLSSRAEIVRFLLTSRSRDVTALAVAEAASYAKRNVAEALGQLARSDFVTAFWIGNEGRYGIDLERWARLLEIEPAELPAYRPWPALLSALREVLIWALDPELDDSSDYLLASRARELMDSVGPRLAASGVRLTESGTGADYWVGFVETVESALSELNAPESSRRAS